MMPAAALVPALASPVNSVARIAVLRANGIGDYLFALPALCSLRTTYPDAELTVIGSPWQRSLEGRPGPVDRFEIAPALHGVREPVRGERGASKAELESFFAGMREREFDLAVQMHGGGRNSNPFVNRLGARVTVGLRTPDAEGLDRWLPFQYFQHEVVRYLEVASLAGAPPVTHVPRWTVTEEDRAKADVVVPREGPAIAVLNPGAGSGRRRWPAEKFARVGDALAQSGARVVVTGGDEDRLLTAGVRSLMREEAIDAAGKLGLEGLGALFERAAVVVSNDTGPLHLARAVDTATIGIYWCGNVINAGPLVNARHRVALSWQLACPECGANCMESGCDHDTSFVENVPVDEVLAEAHDLWNREAPLAAASTLSAVAGG